MSVVADLHVHSTYSDGALTPAELVSKAALRGLQWLALTDHDTVEGWWEAFQWGQQLGVRVIPALEITCYELGREFHVLGYGVAVDDVRLRQHAEQAWQRRLRRMERMVGHCRRLGLWVSIDDVLECAPGSMPGRPHLAAALVQKGYCPTVRDAFAHYLEVGKPAYEPPEEFPVVRALGLIHATGGIAVVAHPRRSFLSASLLLSFIRRGFDGVEAIHPAHGQQLRAYYATFARCHRLVMTGGSDFHGTRVYDEVNFGATGLTAEQLDVLLERLPVGALV